MQIINNLPVLCLSGNLPDLLLLSQPNEVVTITLFQGAKQIIEELYKPDADNKIKVRYRNIIARELSAEIPAFNQKVFHQANGYGDFKITVKSNLGSSIDIFSRVIKGEVSTDILDNENFLTSNFLTWQPQLKYIQYHDPEWLSYYAINSSVLKITAYTFPGDVATTKTYAVLPAGELTTINLNYGLILAAFASQGIPQYYDVFVERSGRRQTYVQRYVFSQEKIEFNDLFVFENSVGGIDTIRFTGDSINRQEYTFEKALFDEDVLDYNSDQLTSFKKNTGYFRTKNEKLWSLDFFVSLLKFKNQDGDLLRVYADDPDLESMQGDLTDYTFTYTFSNKSEAMNLSRQYEAPPLLQLDDEIDGGFFELPPRINHYPYATTTDVIIPVQYPYESIWRKLSLIDLLSGTLEPGTGGDDTSINIVSGNFGEWTNLPDLNANIIEEVPLQFKADLVSFPKRAIVFLTGQFRINPAFATLEIILGNLPAFARPEKDLKKYFIIQNIEMILQISANGAVIARSKDGFNLPVDPAGHPFYIDSFYNPDILSIPAVFTYDRVQSFQRSNCNNGYMGTEVEFIKSYQAASMALAEQLSTEDLDYETEGEAWANDPGNGGTCILDPVIITYTSTRTQNFSRQCLPGYLGTSVEFSKNYTSVVNQADADSIAANDSANYNVLGQAFANDANNGGTCSLETIYIWGKITEENIQSKQGAQWADIMLRTYKGNSGVNPPAAVEGNSIACTVNPIAINYRAEGTYPGPPNNFNVNMANTTVIRLVAPNTSSSNPFYPKQLIWLPDGTFLYSAFNGKARGEMVLLQTIN
jgi:hypothetical protein